MFKLLKKITLGCSLAAVCCATQASALYCGDQCCPPTCCEDGPLTCNSFGIQIKGGVTPTWFSEEGHLLIFNPFISPFVFEGRKAPQFDKLFELPWQVGAELQWNASTHVQFFAEYAYVNAKGKRNHFFLDDVFRIRNRHRDFETNGFYLGARYYFGNLWCNECGTSSIAPFVGFKGGLVWPTSNRVRSHLLVDDVVTDLGNHSAKQRTLLSAGVQVGLDWSINCNWGVVFTVEAVGTQGLRNPRNIPVLFQPIEETSVSVHPTNFGLGDTGHLISVPVTIGVRYTF